MVSAHKTGICPWCIVSSIGYSGRESAVTTSPVVIRNKVKVVVECRLGLLPNDPEDRVDGAEPVRVHER